MVDPQDTVKHVHDLEAEHWQLEHRAAGTIIMIPRSTF